MAITFLFCILSGRFFYVQVLWQGDLKGRALDQWTREIPIVAERGRIVDRNNIPLALNNTSYTVYARSNAIKDKEGTANALSSILGVDGIELLKKLENIRASEITVARQISKDRIESLSEKEYLGVYYSRDNTRVYPRGESLCQVIGFTSIDSMGTAGIEKYYNKYLSGENGQLLYETDLVGIDLKGAVAAYKPAKDGYNVQITIDLGIQELVETALRRVALEYSPTSAECIVLDPNTFEILALANYPSFDLNNLPRDEVEILNSLSRNRIVCDIYEPGSTFKVITSAVDLEEYSRGNKNAFSANYIFSSSRTRSVDGTTVKCWSNHANGKHCNQTLSDALNNSCNPCFTDIALALGKETFYEYLSDFGFGSTTGIDYGGEALGMLIPKTAVRNCDLARIGFGQTIAVSGLQLACGIAASINGGYYYTPHLLKKIYASDGYVLEENKATLKNRTVSEKTSRELSKMLEDVITYGSGKRAYIEGYKIGGKTGTAQKYENGHIAMGKYVSSFVGFFPSDSPQYLALVVVDEPVGAYYGSVVAAPCAKDIFEGIISLKNIQPKK